MEADTVEVDSAEYETAEDAAEYCLMQDLEELAELLYIAGLRKEHKMRMQELTNGNKD
ncbi:MAG: hypothetical protein LBP22_08730 [Deltaproteobacteria bacterium]|jgi:hypothetical protein|nr:hypothetical protein [Deltaproteobacteria bacterium]